METQEMIGTIECYYGTCPNHNAQKGADPDEGPYCYENTCTATAEQLAAFQVIREDYLRTLPKSEAKLTPIVRKADESICLQVKKNLS